MLSAVGCLKTVEFLSMSAYYLVLEYAYAYPIMEDIEQLQTDFEKEHCLRNCSVEFLQEAARNDGLTLYGRPIFWDELINSTLASSTVKEQKHWRNGELFSRPS